MGHARTISTCDRQTQEDNIDQTSTESSDSFDEPQEDPSSNIAECTFPIDQLEVQALVMKDGQTNYDENGIYNYPDFASVKIFDTFLS